jgi:hypothetical protein
VAIMLAVGTRGGLAPADLASWIFGAFFLNGLISLYFCWRYRQPLVFFWTIPGTVLVGPALAHLSFAEVIGAYYATGALMLVLGWTGWVARAMNVLPMPIVMAMVGRRVPALRARPGVRGARRFLDRRADDRGVPRAQRAARDRPPPPAADRRARRRDRDDRRCSDLCAGGDRGPAARRPAALRAGILLARDDRARRAARDHGPRGAERAGDLGAARSGP